MLLTKDRGRTRLEVKKFPRRTCVGSLLKRNSENEIKTNCGLKKRVSNYLRKHKAEEMAPSIQSQPEDSHLRLRIT